ncbi:MAG TPA: MFS transporter [Ktedonobacterales bacterium]|nr:MFS transporter [Ktedonobacterales bacterium]
MATTVEARQRGNGRRGRQGRQRAEGSWPANARWNFVVLGADVAFFTFALNIASAYVVLPLFVHQLTADNTAVALISALRALGLYAPQLLVAPLVERRRHALPLILRLTVLERVPYLALAIATVLFAQSNPNVLLVFFFVMILLALGGGGLTFPAWLDLIARAMPKNWLGRFLGFWQGLGGILGIGGAAVAAFVLAHVKWPLNFALCFLLTFAAMAVSFVLLALGREPPRTLVGEDAPNLPAADVGVAQSDIESASEKPTGSRPTDTPAGASIPAETSSRSSRPARMGALWALLREDGNLRRLLITNALGGFATMATALFAVSALNLGGLSNAEAGAEATVLALASTGGYFLWGPLGDALGHKLVLACAAACAGLAALMAVWAHGVVPYAVVFLLMGLNLSATFIAGLTFIAEFGPEVKRPTYSALSSVAFAPFAVGTPLLAGWLADQWGYQPVFVISALAGALTTLCFIFWVPDPRKRARQTAQAATVIAPVGADAD